MPVISIFFGIIIRIHYDDHNPPHFHAYYQGFDTVYDINKGEKIETKAKDNFPKNADRIISSWAKDHKKALLKCWDLAKNGLLPGKVPGADKV